MHAVARTAQVRPRLGLAARGLAGAAIVVVAVGLGGVLIAGGRLWGAASGGATPDPAIVATDAPASSADTTPTASDDAATTAAPHETVATNPMTGAPLRPDSIAVVTREGTRLRVRSAPGTGGDSALLEPVLGSGTRMLVLAGPVRASKLDWYQVHVPNVELSGWVAAGRDGIAWIKASQPACPPRLDAAALYDTPPIDLLVCTAANPFSLVIDDIMVLDQDGPCPYAVTDRTCRLDPAWLGPTVALLLGGRDAGDGEMGMAMSLPAAVEPRLTAGGSAPGDTGRARVTLRLDHPAARSCRALGADGAPVEEPWITAVRCRLRLVLEGVEPPPVP